MTKPEKYECRGIWTVLNLITVIILTTLMGGCDEGGGGDTFNPPKLEITGDYINPGNSPYTNDWIVRVEHVGGTTYRVLPNDYSMCGHDYYNFQREDDTLLGYAPWVRLYFTEDALRWQLCDGTNAMCDVPNPPLIYRDFSKCTNCFTECTEPEQ